MSEPEAVELLAALDVVLSLARSNNYAHPDKQESLAMVEKLRATIRESLR